MWMVILSKYLDMPNVQGLDVGTGAGRFYELLLNYGAKKENILALEPNLILANYLHTKKHIPCILGGTDDMGHNLLQNREFNLVTANMVINHLTTEQFGDFVTFCNGVLMKGGVLIYTIPYPERKAKKYGFDCSDNSVVINEPAPWGGKVRYHHRSEEFQVENLEHNGFEVKRIHFGYENFISKDKLREAEKLHSRNFQGTRRVMFIAVKR